MHRSIFGPKISHPAQRCEGGSDMILLVGTSFDAATRKKYNISIRTGSASFLPSLKEDELRSFLQRVTRLTTMRWFSGTSCLAGASQDALILARRRARTVVDHSSEATLHPFEYSALMCCRCSRTEVLFGNRPAAIACLARSSPFARSAAS